MPAWKFKRELGSYTQVRALPSGSYKRTEFENVEYIYWRSFWGRSGTIKSMSGSFGGTEEEEEEGRSK